MKEKDKPIYVCFLNKHDDILEPPLTHAAFLFKVLYVRGNGTQLVK